MDQDAATDFFISYTHNDQRWAEWIAWHLEGAGYRTVVQAWDFLAGGNFILAMDEATQNATRTIAVGPLSWNASMACSVAARISSRSSTTLSGGNPPALSPMSREPRQACRRSPIWRAASIPAASRSSPPRGNR